MKPKIIGWVQWYKPVIPGLGKAEAGGSQTQILPEQPSETLSQKGAGDMAECPDLQYHTHHQKAGTTMTRRKSKTSKTVTPKTGSLKRSRFKKKKSIVIYLWSD